LKWGLLFTWVSWQFERQADVFGARALTLAGLPCDAPCRVHHADLLAATAAPSGERVPRPSTLPANDATPLGYAGLRLPPALAMNILSQNREHNHREAPTEPICVTAASVFADTLHDVARLNGVSPDAGSWRHPSISARSRSLQRLALDPFAAERFEGRIRRI